MPTRASAEFRRRTLQARTRSSCVDPMGGLAANASTTRQRIEPVSWHCSTPIMMASRLKRSPDCSTHKNRKVKASAPAAEFRTVARSRPLRPTNCQGAKTGTASSPTKAGVVVLSNTNTPTGVDDIGLHVLHTVFAWRTVLRVPRHAVAEPHGAHNASCLDRCQGPAFHSHAAGHDRRANIIGMGRGVNE
jgi:hypothetical protein